MREAPFWNVWLPFYPLTFFICGKFFWDPFETFWVISDKTQFFGSFQTKLFFCVFEAKNQFFSEKVQKRAKKIFWPFWTTLKHLGHALASCHVWPFLRIHVLSIRKVNNFLYLFEIQLYLCGCLAEGISSGEPSPGLARAPPSCRNYLPVIPWNSNYISLGLKSYVYLKYSVYCFLL